ncbi:hypothetical protein V2J09_019609 [Rumex salicifolius]
MADELMQPGIFEGMAWWNTIPAKSFLPAPYCSMAVGGGDGLGATWPVTLPRAASSAYNLFEDPQMVDSSSFQPLSFDASAWNNPQDIMHGGDYVNDGMFNLNTIIQAGEWSTGNELHSGSSSPPAAAVNSSGTEGSTLTCDSHQLPVVNSFPVDPTSMFPNGLLNGDHQMLNPCDNQWNDVNNGNQVLGSSSFDHHQRQEQIIDQIRVTLLGVSPAPSWPSSPKPQSRKTTNSKVNKNEESCNSGSEPSIKRQRIETPSSLPTFKVRKEKLGDRITALQQLVSPFGKTDTASVLHEAIEYIKFLHDQVNALSTPYMKNGAPIQHHHQQQAKDDVARNQDLKSQGLCLVPISSTFPVAHETTADFWTPTFGATFR